MRRAATVIARTAVRSSTKGSSLPSINHSRLLRNKIAETSVLTTSNPLSHYTATQPTRFNSTESNKPTRALHQKKLEESHDQQKQNAVQEESVQTSAKGLLGKLRGYLEKYGLAFAVSEVGLSILTTGVLYLFIREGVDTEGFVGYLEDVLQGPHTHDAAEQEIEHWTAAGGSFALAFAANKLLSPIRTPIALAATPTIAKYLPKRLQNSFASFISNNTNNNNDNNNEKKKE